MAVQGSTRAEKGVHIKNSAGVASRDVMSLRRWTSEGIASWSSGISWFVLMGTRSGTYIPVASSVNRAVPNNSGGVWNWSVVSRQAEA